MDLWSLSLVNGLESQFSRRALEFVRTRSELAKDPLGRLTDSCNCRASPLQSREKEPGSWRPLRLPDPCRSWGRCSPLQAHFLPAPARGLRRVHPSLGLHVTESPSKTQAAAWKAIGEAVKKFKACSEIQHAFRTPHPYACTGTPKSLSKTLASAAASRITIGPRSGVGTRCFQRTSPPLSPRCQVPLRAAAPTGGALEFPLQRPGR